MKIPTVEEMGKKAASEALDNYVIDGRTLRQWIDILRKQKPEYCSNLKDDCEFSGICKCHPKNNKPHTDISETNAGKWVPCSERLPDKGAYYLVTIKDVPIVWYRFWDGKRWWIETEDEEILAWMLFPEPWKEGAE